MSEAKLTSGKVAFETEGRLLQELGERLVANADIALVELLKNAYDADARECFVRVAEDHAALIITDTGTGMTQEQFLGRWMKIATGHKANEPVSPRFGRKRTGQKGIGRFAVRYLGTRLTLDTVADDPKLKRKTRLTAHFDWEELDAAKDLGDIQISYVVHAVEKNTPTGTTLVVESLRRGITFLESREFRTNVLRIVSPLESLDRGRFKRPASGDYEVDPGFRVSLPSEDKTEDVDIAGEVLSRAWATLRVDLRNNKLEYTVHVSGSKKEASLLVPLKSKIGAGLVADIRFFPRRSGIFSGGKVDGRAAWGWVRDNYGVAVVDHGFRLRPFGFVNDDWLNLDLDSAHNERDWRTDIAKRNFPISQEVKARPADNPALNLPTNYQLVGAVFVESQASGSGDDLTVAMDREGFLHNESFSQLVEVIRGGIEYLAFIDKRQMHRQAVRKAREVAARTREDFKAAIVNIRKSPTLSAGDKSRLITHYGELSQKLEEVEHYGREARRKLETMGLLGVVAGFMTHEAARILDGLERALTRLRKMVKRDEDLAAAVLEIEQGYEAFKGYIEYTSLFVESMQRSVDVPFKPRPQVDRIIEKFGAFAQERGIKCQNKVDRDAVVKGVPLSAYSGVLLNLYTNALKAVLAREDRTQPPQVVFKGWNEEGHHVIEVMDKGVGVPAELRDRIFDPLFTTTSSVNNPLGSGMGLGLSLIREVVQHSGGNIRIVDAPEGFTTCFRARFEVSK